VTLTHDTDNIDGIDDIEDTLFNSPITYDEIADNINHLNANQAVGGTLIPQQLIYEQLVLLPFLCKLFSKIFSSGEFPDQWTKSIIVPVHKKKEMLILLITIEELL